MTTTSIGQSLLSLLCFGWKAQGFYIKNADISACGNFKKIRVLDLESKIESTYFVQLLGNGYFGANIVKGDAHGKKLTHYYGYATAIIQHFKLPLKPVE